MHVLRLKMNSFKCWRYFIFVSGGSSGSDSEGMIPRSVRLIFSRCEELKTKGWEYKIEASFLEIYNEQIRDLLGNGKATHDIKMVNNEITVTNLKVRVDLGSVV